MKSRHSLQWVHDGGSLLLIADHMPFPGSVAKLADAFGIVFLNGYAKKSVDEGGTLIFTRAGGLADHPITPRPQRRRRDCGDQGIYGPGVPRRRSRRAADAHAAGLVRVLCRTKPASSLHDARGIRRAACCRAQCCVMGKAASPCSAKPRCSARRRSARRPGRRAHGHERPEAPQNAQFVLNVLHWLSGLLQD